MLNNYSVRDTPHTPSPATIHSPCSRNRKSGTLTGKFVPFTGKSVRNQKNAYSLMLNRNRLQRILSATRKRNTYTPSRNKKTLYVTRKHSQRVTGKLAFDSFELIKIVKHHQTGRAISETGKTLQAEFFSHFDSKNTVNVTRNVH